MSKIPKVLDVETTGLNWTKCGIIGWGSYSKQDKDISFTKDIESEEKYEYIYHNGSFDVKVAHKNGIELPFDHDTILMASLLQYRNSVKEYYYNSYDEETKLKESLSLDALAKKDLDIQNTWKIDWNKDTPTYDEIKEHCLMDCRVTYHLFEIYKERLINNGLWEYYVKLMMPFARMLVDVECAGIRLDLAKLTKLKADYGERLKVWEVVFRKTHKEVLDIVSRHLIRDKIAKVKPGKKPETKQNRIDKIVKDGIEFNPRSNVHMNKLLELKGLEIKDKNGKRTSSSKLLFRYRHDPVIGSILEYKKIKKIHRDFLCKWDDLRIDDVLYTNFRLWATRTGRLSSAEPNLQQVPKDKEIRELFIPREGKVFTVVDAKQMEARLAAYFSKEPNLIKAFKDGTDVYGQIAIDLMGLDCLPNDVKLKYPKERQVGKQLFLASLYGQGSKSLHFILSREHEIDITLSECRSYKRLFNKTYHKLISFGEKLKEEVMDKGYITNWFGRKVFIPKDKAYRAINYYIQGSSSELLSFVQLNIVKHLPEGARILLLVHDEVVYEHKPEDTDKIVDIVKKYMIELVNSKYDMFMDMDISTGKDWSVK